MTNFREVEIRDKTNTFIELLISAERHYREIYRLESDDYATAMEYGDSTYEDTYRQIHAESKAIERAINKFQEEYELSDSYINSIFEFARDEAKWEMRI